MHLFEDIVDRQHRCHGLTVIIRQTLTVLPIFLQIRLKFDHKLAHILIIDSLILGESDFDFALEQAELLNGLEFGHLVVLFEFAFHFFVVRQAEELLSDSAVAQFRVAKDVGHEEL